jgi:hypothetical protein
MKKIKNSMVFIIGLIIGILFFGSITYASSSILSSNVYYDNSNSTLESTTTQEAIDELYFKLYFKLYPFKAKGTLYYQMMNNSHLDNTSSEYVTSDTGIDFSKISSDTNGKGIYELSSTADDAYPIYYYRGEVTDNNVLFANFCWKIVRTTKTGGVKLIYNGSPSSGQCNNTGTYSQLSSTSKFNSSYNSNAYVGYMYGTAGSSSYAAEHANTNNSTIKTAIDTWYKSNMTDYTDKLEDTVWCDDRSIDTVSGYGTGLGYGTNQTAYNARYRLVTNKTPSLSCTNANDKFTVSSLNANGELTYPVALLTADEIAYAGGKYGSSYSNSTYYLYTGQDFWLLSPYYFNGSKAYMWYVSSSGYLGGYTVHASLGVRPAISLKAGTKFTDGDGTTGDPYVVS